MTVELNTIKKAYQNWKSLNEIISNEMDSRKAHCQKWALIILCSSQPHS